LGIEAKIVIENIDIINTGINANNFVNFNLFCRNLLVCMSFIN